MSQKDIMKKIWKYLRNYRIFIITSILLAVLVVALQLYIPILTGDAIDYIIDKGRVDFDGIFVVLKKMAVVIGITAICQWIMNVCNNRITYHTIRDIRKQAFEKIQKLPLKYIDSHSYGEIVSRVIADVDQFADGLLMGFTQFFTGVVTILITLVFMFRVNVMIAVVVVVVTPLSLIVASFIAKRTYKMFQLQSEARGKQTALIDEMIGNQKVVQAFGHEDEALETFDEINGKLAEYSLKATFFSSITNPATRFVNNLVYACVALIGAIYAVMGGISVGQLSCFLSYANQYTKPFNEISGVVTELQNAIACAGRIFELMEEEPQIPDAKDAVELVTPSGQIEMNHVAFSYVPDKPLIRDFNLTVSPGQRVAIVGPTGCGKTTLINLLMRFYDVTDGSIKIGQQSPDNNKVRNELALVADDSRIVKGIPKQEDKKAGHSGKQDNVCDTDGALLDVRDITRESLRTSFGMVLQETWLRAGTIRDNILIAKPDATDEEMIAAAKASHAHSFIKRLPKGYDTVINEDGGSLSQGQKQLLCITRVMLCLPPMLILDEATSSIDTRTEIRIQKAFAKMMKGRTSFIVAHRLSTIQEADIILVMKDGNVIEQGDHETLLAQNGFYAELYNSQYTG